MLKDLKLDPVYDSAECHLVNDLMVPLLKHSSAYMRGVGYFSSGWLRVAAEGIVSLIENGGKACFVVSPILDEKDWESFKMGSEAHRNAALKSILSNNVKDLRQSLEEDTRNCLAWLIADELLEFRFAVNRDPWSQGDYHDKVGIFTDKNNDVVAIHGSFNDSIKGTLNGEAFSVFSSWIPGQAAFVEKHRKRLLQLWERNNQQFMVYDVPDIVRLDLISLRSSSERPYLPPVRTTLTSKTNCKPCVSIRLHEYQEEAIVAWESSGCRGLLEMATGTGKTVTALAMAVRAFEQKTQLAVVVLVPYLHLIEQWYRNCIDFGFKPIACSSAHADWRLNTTSMIQDYNRGSLRHLCLIATHVTAATPTFLKIVAALPSATTLIIADEAHALGACNLRRALFPEANLRIGLSATPRRWYDDSGTDHLFSYFSGVCFEYPLERAIGKFLVPYEYYPIPVNLTPEENDLYEQISNKLAVIISSKKRDVGTQKKIERLLQERSLIVASAEQKLPTLISMLSALSEKRSRDELKHVLVYCAPGSHRNVLQEIAKLKLRCHEFVHNVPLAEREIVLQQFASGDIQVIVAVKCLDEGVDVPSTKYAFFLASTTNPREFVQRRGRVLRKAQGKTKAMLYDFIVMPAAERANDGREVDRSLIKREMPRFAEFSSSALNEYEARAVIRPILNDYEMLSLLEKKPWDIYKDLARSNDGLL